MFLKQISVFIENKPGAVCGPCKVLADANVNMSTLTLADTKDFGILRIIAKEWERAVKALRDAGFTASITNVVAVQCAHVPGGLYAFLKELNSLELNVEYLYATATDYENQPVLIFRFDDPDGAIVKLKGLPSCKLIKPEQFFTL